MNWINRDSTWGGIYCPALNFNVEDNRKVIIKFNNGEIAEWNIWDSSNSWEEDGYIAAYIVLD